MTHKPNRQDHLPISATVEQMSLLSINDACAKGKQNTINSTSYAQEIRQHAQHAECNNELDETLPGLPNEIMALIFSYIENSPSILYACTLANKRYYDLANSMLWKAPSFLNYGKATRFFDCMIAMADQRRMTLGRLIHVIRLANIFGAEKWIPQLLPYMPNLHHLSLSLCYADDVLRHLPNHSRLTSLKLNAVIVTKSGFDALAQCRLEDFEWTTDENESSTMLQHLKPCPLRRLAILLPPSIHSLSTPLLTPFTQLMMDPLSFQQLTVLELSGCPDINDQVLIAFFNHHPLLEQLHLSDQYYVTDATLDAITLPLLTHATLTHLQHITTAAVQRLITNCPLTYLDVSYCYKVDIVGFPAFVVKKGDGGAPDMLLTPWMDDLY